MDFLNILMLLNIHKFLMPTKKFVELSDFCFERTLTPLDRWGRIISVIRRLKNIRIALGWWRWDLLQRRHHG